MQSYGATFTFLSLHLRGRGTTEWWKELTKRKLTLIFLAARSFATLDDDRGDNFYLDGM